MNPRDPFRLGRVVDALGVCARYLLCYPWVAPRRTMRFIQSVGHRIRIYGQEDSQANIASKPLEAVFPGIERLEVTVADAAWREGNVQTAELYALCAIARVRRIRCALEIGTYDGFVMANLVRNTDPQARLITVDLRPEDLARLRWPLAPGEGRYVKKAAIGEKIHRLPAAERARITQLYGDSSQLDFRPYYGHVDLVFIDGSHQYDYVEHDSQEAFRMRSARGLIVWQDYLAWPDVTRYLNTLRHQHPLVHIQGTSLVVYGVT